MKKGKVAQSVRWKLARDGTEILKADRAGSLLRGPMVVDLLSPQDMAKREARRRHLLTNNSEILDDLVSTKMVPSSEDLLLRKEAEEKQRQAFLALFAHFKQDKVATKILVAAFSGEVQFRSSQAIVKKYGYTLAQVIAAKQRIKYFADVTTDHVFKDMLSSFKGA